MTGSRKTRREFLRSVAAAVAILWAAAPARGKAYYVATDGSDENPGTQARPFATLQKAADAVRPGDACVVRGGTYRQAVRWTRSGTKDKPIRFGAVAGETVILSGAEPVRGTWALHQGRIYKTKVQHRFGQLASLN